MAFLKSYNQHRRGHVHKGAPHTSSTWLFPAHFTLTSMVAITITNPSVTLLMAKSATLWHVDDESRYEEVGGRHPPLVLAFVSPEAIRQRGTGQMAEVRKHGS